MTIADDYRDRRILVIGYGRTGAAVSRFFLDAGARVRVAERRWPAELGDVDARIDLRHGDADLHCLDGVDLVVPSPGVAAHAPLLRAAVARRIPVRAGGERPFVGGNLGTPLITAVDGAHSMAVVEVSSFQLEWVEQFRPRVGVLLNVTEDHLDRYAGLDAYGATKLRLFAQQTADDVAVLNGGDAWIRTHARGLAATTLWFGAGEGAVLRADAAAIRMRVGGREETYPLAKIALDGAHNRENMMAAIAAARAVGIAPAAVQQALDAFRPLPHRLELVRERDGVRWIDDSKGTNVGAVVKSLEGHRRSVVLLAGGIEKGGDYRVLVEPVRRAVKHAILFGAARDMLARTLGGATEVELADTLADAVARAAAVAKPGDTILLSPACASFDMFRDYADRGNQFQALVQAL